MCCPQLPESTTPALLLSSLPVLLLSWCSCALVLRCLRDTRAGLWALPLCLPFFPAVGLDYAFTSMASRPEPIIRNEGEA